MEKELEYYGGDGWYSFTLRKGDVIEIRYGEYDAKKRFTNTVEAIEFYDSIKDLKFAWLIRESGFSELIEGHQIKPINTMKNTKTLFDQAIEIIEGGEMPYMFFIKHYFKPQVQFFFSVVKNECTVGDRDGAILYTRLLLARELWNDGQEKYWKAGLFK